VWDSIFSSYKYEDKIQIQTYIRVWSTCLPIRIASKIEQSFMQQEAATSIPLMMSVLHNETLFSNIYLSFYFILLRGLGKKIDATWDWGPRKNRLTNGGPRKTDSRVASVVQNVWECLVYTNAQSRYAKDVIMPLGPPTAFHNVIIQIFVWKYKHFLVVVSMPTALLKLILSTCYECFIYGWWIHRFSLRNPVIKNLRLYEGYAFASNIAGMAKSS